MNILKKVLITLTIFFSFFGIALAEFDASKFEESSGLEDTGNDSGYSVMNWDNDTTPEEIIGDIIKTILSLIGIAFLVLTLYGGLIWMKARGNEQDVEKAKKIIQDALIGLIVVLAAYAITYALSDIAFELQD